MSQKYSLAHLTVLGCAPPEMTYIAGRAGYDYVSFRPIFMGLPGEPNYALGAPENKEMLKQTKTALNDTGVKLLDIELARIFDGVDVKSYLPALEVAAELGGTEVLSSVWTPEWNYSVEKFAELCDLAKDFGLTVNLEFVTFASVTNLSDAVKFLRAVDKENIGLMVDTLHFSRSRVTLEELDTVPREWYRFAHLCDGPAEIPDTREGLIFTARDARFYPGEGGIDIAGILNRIPKIPYSIELPHLARVKEMGYAEHAHRCIETAKQYFNDHRRA